MDECRRMGLDVMGPDVNESVYKFTVKSQGYSFWDGHKPRIRTQCCNDDH
jgi:DNA polymerase III alpha subunit